MFRIPLLVSILWLSGCASMQVTSDYDAQADFNALARYDWLPVPKVRSGDPGVQYDSLLEPRVRAAVDAQLAAKGYARSTESPDFLVTYHVAIDRKVSVTYLHELYGYGPGWGPSYRRRVLHYGYPARDVRVSEYDQGTLIVDIVRASDKQLIWRGTAADEVYPDGSMTVREQRVREAVDGIMALFPPSKTE